MVLPLNGSKIFGLKARNGNGSLLCIACPQQPYKVTLYVKIRNTEKCSQILKYTNKYWKNICSASCISEYFKKKKHQLLTQLLAIWNQEMLAHLKKILENICFALLLCHRNLIRWHCMLRLETPKNTNKYWKILKKYWKIFALHCFFVIAPW